MQQNFAAVQHLADVQIECRSVDPFHEKDREAVAANQNSFGRVTEFRKIRNGRFPEMFLNGAITLIAIAEIPAKTSHREIAVAIRRFQFVDVSKLARGDERHPQTIDS